jgi:hypothetical protein
VGSGQVAGSVGLVLLEGVVHPDEDWAAFEAMLECWARQQKSRMLGDKILHKGRNCIVAAVTERCCSPRSTASYTRSFGGHLRKGQKYSV